MPSHYADLIEAALERALGTKGISSRLERAASGANLGDRRGEGQHMGALIGRLPPLSLFSTMC